MDKERFTKRYEAVTRPISEKDADALFRLFDTNRESFAKNDVVAPDKFRTIEDVRTYLNTPEKRHQGVYVNGTLVGLATVVPWEENPEAVEVGIIIDQHMRGKGVAPAVAAQMIPFIESLKKDVFAVVNRNNMSSERLTKRLGFQFDHAMTGELDAYRWPEQEVENKSE